MAQSLLNKSPTSLDKYVGNENIVEWIDISIEACKIKGVPLSHMLLTGRRGTGKTTLATKVAEKVKASYLVVSARAITTLPQLNNLFIKNLPDILIMDEIHRIDPSFSDMIHEAMDSFKYSYADEDEVIRTAILRPFTLIGCTTISGKLQLPFVSRFTEKFQLRPYTQSELATIITNVTKNNNIDIDYTAALEIAKRSFRIPRNALNLLETVYKYAIVYNKGRITKDIALIAFRKKDIDERGLGNLHRDILSILSQSRTSMGLDNLANRLNEDRDTLLEQYEPDLLDLGFIERMRTGRKITAKGIEHLRGLK